MLLSPIRKWLIDSRAPCYLDTFPLVLTKCAMWLFMVFEYKWHLERKMHTFLLIGLHMQRKIGYFWKLNMSNTVAIWSTEKGCFAYPKVFSCTIATIKNLESSANTLPFDWVYSIYRKKMFVSCWVKVWNDECISTWGTSSSTMTYKYALVISKYRHLVSVQSNSASLPHNI